MNNGTSAIEDVGSGGVRVHGGGKIREIVWQ
jgi:hypothetical protein